MCLFNRAVCTLFLCCLVLHMVAQDKPDKLAGTSRIDSLMAASDWETAKAELHKQICFLYL